MVEENMESEAKWKSEGHLQFQSQTSQASSQKAEMSFFNDRKTVEKSDFIRREEVGGRYCRFFYKNIPNSPSFKSSRVAKSSVIPSLEVAVGICYDINESGERFNTKEEAEPSISQNSKKNRTYPIGDNLSTYYRRSGKQLSLKKSQWSVATKKARLFKPFPKHFVKGRTSFLISWSALSNADLL